MTWLLVELARHLIEEFLQGTSQMIRLGSCHLYNRGLKMVMMMGEHLEKLVGSLKSKLKALKTKKKAYDKMDKSDSMRVEIRSRRAQKLIAETLKIADSPGHKSYAF
ncbi:hypothetical protein J5N97_008001 [Dioscorea zingiberensis]|uniref:Uncharacterized protein n=1 Tax=Dioscorea zingiberensis TaxID=325984 RepID=A0A9D5DDE9_9LILI|nr:hypothetical protein J5N97_008001 [Dioscorea zingiberensis]